MKALSQTAFLALADLRRQLGSPHSAITFVGSIVFVGFLFWLLGAFAIDHFLNAAFLMVPLCTLLQTVPITFNGWGLRESLFVVYFAQVGLPRDNALAFSLVGASLIVVLSLSGAVVWMSRDNAPAANPAA